METTLLKLKLLTVKGLRYPDELRYGPDNPPPHMTTNYFVAPPLLLSDPSDDSANEGPYKLPKPVRSQPPQNPKLVRNYPPPADAPSLGLDRLLAKLGPLEAPAEEVLVTATAQTTIAETTKEPSKRSHTKQKSITVQSLFQQPTHDVAVAPTSGPSLLATLFDTATSTETVKAPYQSNSHTESDTDDSDLEPRVLTSDVITSLMGRSPAPIPALPTTTHSYPASPSTSNDAGSSSQQHTESDDESFTYQPERTVRSPLSRPVSSIEVPKPVSGHGTPIPPRTLAFFAEPEEEVIQDDEVPEIDFEETYLLENPVIKKKEAPKTKAPPARPPLQSAPSLLDQLFMADEGDLSYPQSNASPSPESSPEVSHAHAATHFMPVNGNGNHSAPYSKKEFRIPPEPVRTPLSMPATPAQAPSPSHGTGLAADALLKTLLSPNGGSHVMNGYANGPTHVNGTRSINKGRNGVTTATTKNQFLREVVQRIQVNRFVLFSAGFKQLNRSDRLTKSSATSSGMRTSILLAVCNRTIGYSTCISMDDHSVIVLLCYLHIYVLCFILVYHFGCVLLGPLLFSVASYSYPLSF